MLTLQISNIIFICGNAGYTNKEPALNQYLTSSETPVFSKLESETSVVAKSDLWEGSKKKKKSYFYFKTL